MRMKLAAVFVMSALFLLSCKEKRDGCEVANGGESPRTHVTRWGFDMEEYSVSDGVIGNNELLSHILTSAGVKSSTIFNLERETKETFSVRQLRAGKSYYLLTHKTDTLNVPDYFIYHINPVEYVVYSLKDSLYAYKGELAADTVRKCVKGSIRSSLWNAVLESGAKPELAGTLSDIYSWTIDFFGIQPRDSFFVCFEEVYVDTLYVGVGRVLASNFITAGKDHFAFRYAYRDGREEYFDENGASLRRAFLKAPLQYKRISSHFSNARRHPVTKVVRPHHGVDYAAPAGTPVYTIGDGVVTFRGWDSKGGGNYVKIKHNATYTTEYLHLKGFAAGLAVGQRVNQGQLIGYVGSTGVSTGPHLDFRVFKNGTPINPLSMDLPAVDPIASEHVPAYLQAMDTLMRMLQVPLQSGLEQ